MEAGRLRAHAAHLDGAVTGLGEVVVFFAELVVREHLYLVLAVGKFAEALGEVTHTDGLRIAVGLGAGDLNDDAVGRGGGDGKGGQEGEGAEEGRKTFHKDLSSYKVTQHCHSQHLRRVVFVEKQTLLREN